MLFGVVIGTVRTLHLHPTGQNLFEASDNLAHFGLSCFSVLVLFSRALSLRTTQSQYFRVICVSDIELCGCGSMKLFPAYLIQTVQIPAICPSVRCSLLQNRKTIIVHSIFETVTKYGQAN